MLASMLACLRVRNLAIVDEVRVEFGPGLNVITGETGAGKSILADALNLVLGERAEKSVIRAGESQCQVEAVFSLADPGPINAALADAGLDPCEDGNLVIRRVITPAAGKIVVNDSPATLQTLRRIGMLLVDMHGPHEHQSLLDSAFQREVLDAYGHLECERDACRCAWQALLALQADRDRLDDPGQNVAAQLDLLAFQIGEIEGAGLDAGDEEALLQEHTRITNAARIIELAGGIGNALMEDDASAFNALVFARRSVPELAQLLPEGAEWQHEIEAVAIQLQELASAIGSVAQRIDADPERLQWVEDRIALLQKLKRKYGSTLPDMLAFLDEARRQHSELATRGERMAELEQRICTAQTSLQTAGQALTGARRRVAGELSGSIAAQLLDLGLAHARFTVDVRPAVAPGPTGLDTIDFGFSPNPGEPLRPLKAIASSGEISRVMLAVKAVLARHDRIPVLVFDEIDANLGGETGSAVGRKLAAVAVDHQVICITHLPQVAVYGTRHWVVSKVLREGRTKTLIAPITDETRVEELARMLGGKTLTSVTLRHAREMLARPAPAANTRVAEALDK